MRTIYQKTVRSTSLRTLDDFHVGSWIHTTDPTEKDIEWLVSVLGIEEGHIKDALDIHEVPRLEVKDGMAYIFLRIPMQNKSGEVATLPFLIVVGDTFVATISKEEVPFLPKIIGEHKSNPLFTTTQKTRLVILLLTEVSRLYDKFLVDIRKKVRRARGQVERITNESILRLVQYESMLNDFLSALQPTHTILQSLMYGKVLKLYDDDKDLFEDVYLSNGQLMETCQLNLKAIIHIREAYSAILTNNLNRVIRILTILTVLLTIPNVITSFYGMNVPLPFMHSPHAAFGILATIVLTGIVVYVIFKKQRII